MRFTVSDRRSDGNAAGRLADESEPIRREQERDTELQTLRRKLIAGELSGEPQPFNFAVFSRRKLAQHGA